jgi:hypothetical protein
LALGCIYSINFLNAFFIHFEMLKKFKLKVCACIFTCYVRTKSFHEKSTCSLGCVKKVKLCAKKGFL